MFLKTVIKRAEKNQEKEDKRDSDDYKLGEGANSTVYRSDRGYVVKEVPFDQIEAENPAKSSEDPEDHIEEVKKIERFPWAEIEKREGEVIDHAKIRMSPQYISHSEAEETYSYSDLIQKDLNLFFDLREDGITYKDFKPDNIGYFSENSSESELLAKPIDITDGARKPWEEEENIAERDLKHILELYVKGTPSEDGITDKYSISTSEACQHISDYLEANTELEIDLDMDNSNYT
jgi:hypothetical protein